MEDGGGGIVTDYILFLFQRGRRRTKEEPKQLGADERQKRLNTGSSLPKDRAHVSWEWGVFLDGGMRWRVKGRPI